MIPPPPPKKQQTPMPCPEGCWENEDWEKEDPVDIEEGETEDPEYFEDWKMKTSCKEMLSPMGRYSHQPLFYVSYKYKWHSDQS